MDKAVELAELVKVWWEKHKYDVYGEFDYINVYDDEPEFITMAKEIIGDWEDWKYSDSDSK